MTIKRKSDVSITSSSNSPSSPVKRLRRNNGFQDLYRNGSGPRREKPTVDAASGQTGAFPGLDDVDDNDEQEGDDFGDFVNDDDPTSTRAAMQYLRSVRNEAHNIPSLLVAAKAVSQSEGESINKYAHAGNGFYEDGAYVAAPIMGPVMPARWEEQSIDVADEKGAFHTAASGITAQEACSRQLLANHALQTRQIDSIRAEGRKEQDISFRGGFKALNEIIFTATPEVDRAAALSQDTILRMLKPATQYLKRHRNLSPRFSAWIWSLLCALGDVGTLDSDAVSVVRELGKKAIWMGIGFIGADEADATAAYGDEEEDEGDAEDSINEKENFDSREQSHQPHVRDDKLVQDSSRADPRNRRRNTSSPDPPTLEVLAAAGGPAEHSVAANEEAGANQADSILSGFPNATSIAQTQSNATSVDTSSPREACPDDNTCATIDMIVTLVGEVYGQRDLLEFRTVWSGLWG